MIIVFLICTALLCQCRPVPSQSPAGTLSAVHEEIPQACLSVLNTWYPLVVDTLYGGYRPVWTHDWKNRNDHRKGIVTQARHTWSTSVAAMAYPQNAVFSKAADSGYLFLKNVMWDSVFGGFYEYRGDDGMHHDSRSIDGTKRMYGNAFGIYALCAYAELTGSREALELAKQTFFWLEAHARDPEYGGYFNELMRDGTPMHLSDTPPPNLRTGLKDYNSGIHILEAYTSLYRQWPDTLLRSRLTDVYHLILDRFVTNSGFLHLYYHNDWTPVSYRDSSDTVRRRNIYYDHVSFGHDVETAYLLIEAAHALNLPETDAFRKKTRLMVDHALNYGWDDTHGGMYEAAYYFKGEPIPEIVDFSKTWWVQAETLNALCLMSERYPEDSRYRICFLKQWQYIKQYMTDNQYCGWFENGLDRDSGASRRLKAHHWKTCYHNFRALLNCSRMLEDQDEGSAEE
ncbi:AGE family epimerase/isomerase [bacterium]|nr:AGE family epimerase/isomerase [bacterium]